MSVCCAAMQSFLRLALALLLAACDGPSLPADAGADAGPGLGCGATTPFHPLIWSAPSYGLVPGATREIYVEFERDCLTGAEITFSASEDGVIDVSDSSAIAARTARATLEITGVAEGTLVPVTTTSTSAVTVSPLGAWNAVAVSVTVPSATPVIVTVARAVRAAMVAESDTSITPSSLVLKVISAPVRQSRSNST